MPNYEYDGESILAESDRSLLIEAAGGLSDEPCRWETCGDRALKGKAMCVFHAVEPRTWRTSTARPKNAADAQNTARR